VDDIVSNHLDLPLTFIQVKHLRTIISYSSMISDMVITFYLEQLTRLCNITYLSTSFLSILRTQGWQRLKCYFAGHRNRSRTNFKPRVSGESAVILPCFVDECHWVIIVRREINGRVIFLYADDLNQASTERELKNLISAKTSSTFYPPSTEWIKCINYTYQPHSNECGPRSLLAATILALHPNPSATILLTAMDLLSNS